MRTIKSVSLSLVITLALLAIPTIGMAQDGSIKATLNFDKTFELPGMVFAPGTYVFKTAGNNKQMVQVWNASETELYTTLLTRVDYLNTPAARTEAMLEGNAGESRRAVKSFQVKDNSMGEDFIYSTSEPKSR